eukprot:scaffold1405_cov305-Prasinococcus_capsulatus_cf.AAC.5
MDVASAAVLPFGGCTLVDWRAPMASATSTRSLTMTSARWPTAAMSAAPSCTSSLVDRFFSRIWMTLAPPCAGDRGATNKVSTALTCKHNMRCVRVASPALLAPPRGRGRARACRSAARP